MITPSMPIVQPRPTEIHARCIGLSTKHELNPGEGIVASQGDYSAFHKVSTLSISRFLQSKVQYFATLRPEVALRMAAQLTARRVEAGQAISTQGDAAKSMIVLLEGQAAVYMKVQPSSAADGNEMLAPSSAAGACTVNIPCPMLPWDLDLRMQRNRVQRKCTLQMHPRRATSRLRRAN
jgi:hypothetical protein